MTHVLDSNTAGLWRFDEAASNVANYATAADSSGNGYTATQALDPLKPRIEGGPLADGVQLSRSFDDGGDQVLEVLGTDANLRAVFAADYTFEAWIFIEDASVNHFVFNCAGNIASELEAENILFNLAVLNTGALQAQWEFGAGSNVVLVDTVHTIAEGVWTHVAVACAVGASTTATFYVNGVVGDALVGTNASGGGNASVTIGGIPSGTINLHGRLGDLRLSDTLRTGTEILASFNAATRQHAADGSAFLLYRFAEKPQIPDISTGGLDLAPADLTSVAEIVLPIIAGTGQAVILDGGTDGYFCNKRDDLRAVLAGEWTLECWLQRQDNVAGGIVGVFEYGKVGAAQADNVQALIQIDAADNVVVQWEHSVATLVTGTSVGTFWDATEQSKHHLAIVKRVVGGGNFDVDYYKDGTFVETVITAGQGPDGGDAQDMLLRVGRTSGGNALLARLDDMRLSSVARSAGEILTSYNAGIGGSLAAEVTPPVVTLVSPLSGILGKDTELVLDITDNLGESDIRRASVWHTPQGGKTEVMYDGEGFRVGYSGTRSSITDGFRLTVNRVGGWFPPLIFEASVHDTAGNEAA